MVNKKEKKKKDAFREFAGDFKNEESLEEELEEEGIELKEAENKHFEEED